MKIKLDRVHFRYILNIIISLAILFLLFTKIPFERIVSIIGYSKVPLFFLAVLVGALSIFINAVRWQILLKYLGYKYDLKLLSKLTFMSLFFNIYLPGGVIGDVARVAILPGQKSSKEERNAHLTKVAASVVTDRVAGMVGLMLLAFLGFVICYRLLSDSRIAPIFGSMVLLIIVIFATLFSKKTQRFIKKAFASPLRLFSPSKSILKNVLDALSVYRQNYSIFNKVIPLSILAHLCVVGYFFLLAQSIDIDIGFLKLVAFVPLIEFIAAIPISFGGAGIREAATILLFSSEGIPAAEAMSISLLSFIVILLLGAVGGILFLCRCPKII